MIRYIAFEGIDGAGKTTQAGSMANALLIRNISPIRLAEPTYGATGRAARASVEADPPATLDEQRRLMAKDREHHVRTKVRPALDLVSVHQGFAIVQDRCYLSYPAYQAEIPDDLVPLLEEQRRIAPRPDVIVLLDVSVDVALGRLEARRGAVAVETRENLSHARDNYLKLTEVATERIEVLDGSRPAGRITEEIVARLRLEPHE